MLCVVTPHYLHSEWCSMEVQVALYRLFDEHNDLLVVIFLEDPPPWVLSTYHRLRRLVRRKTYLQWPASPAQQVLFWARLRDALQLPEREEGSQPGVL
ncbi:TLR13 protein, partial [Atractosteus spatula]|nr:TLR13 protein [Atractosteus spatula]